MNVTDVSKASKEGKKRREQDGHQSMSGLFQKLLCRGRSLQEGGQEYPRESSVTSLGLPELCFLDSAFAYMVPLQSSYSRPPAE